MGCTSSTQTSENVKQKSQLVLGYWAIPLKAQPIRYVLELANFPYTETLYTEETALKWFEKDKEELGLDYPNLPFLIHGDFSITESMNIMNYVIELTNQQNLQGKGELKYKIDNIRFLANDLMEKIFLSTRKSDEQEKQEDLNSYIIPKIKQMQKFLGKRTLCFEKLSLADIYVYTAIKNFKNYYPTQYKEFAMTFDPLLNKFDQIPAIKSYHNSERNST